MNEMEPGCVTCVLKVGSYAHIDCPLGLGKSRVGHMLSDEGEVYICSNHSKTTKNFKQELEHLSLLIPYAEKLVKDLKSNTRELSEKRYVQLSHNLKSINAHCIQELYELSPNGGYKNVRESIEAVKNKIASDLNYAALRLFHLQKYNSMMKVEFLVYERIQKGEVKLSFNYYNVRDVVMKTLHMFFEDFTNKSVYVDVEENYESVWLDYESLATALYYLIENATKYVKPDTQINVSFSKDPDYYRIVFSMESHYLTDEDRVHIFDEGYSGEYACAKSVNGAGYGMFRAKHLLKQCGAVLEVDFGDSESILDDVEYAQNVFRIGLPYKKE